ncbi:MAG: PqiC family protein [Burkholderiales bacterium]
MNTSVSHLRHHLAWAFAAAALATLSALFAGCGSEPTTHYYTLMPPPAANEQAAVVTRLDWDVLPVGVPAQVDQPQWVVRTGNGSLAVLEQERWIAPLGDEIRGAVVERLTNWFGPPRAGAAANGAPSWRIRIDVQRFDLIPNQQARLEVDWSVRSERVAVSCRASVSHPVTGLDYIGLARAQQQAVAQLADAIGAALQAASKGQAIAC